MAGFGKFTKVFLVLSIFVLVQCNTSEAKTIPQLLRAILNTLKKVEQRIATYATQAHPQVHPILHDSEQKKRVTTESSVEVDLNNENITILNENKGNDYVEGEKAPDKHEDSNMELMKERRIKLNKRLAHHMKGIHRSHPPDFRNNSKESEESKKVADNAILVMEEDSDVGSKTHKTKNLMAHHSMPKEMKKLHYVVTSGGTDNNKQHMKKMKRKSVVVKDDK